VDFAWRTAEFFEKDTEGEQRLQLLRAAFCRSSPPDASSTATETQVLLHRAQTKGLVHTVDYNNADRSCATLISLPVFDALTTTRSDLQSPLLMAAKSLRNELNRGLEDPGKLFEHIIFQALECAILARKTAFPLSELFCASQQDKDDFDRWRIIPGPLRRVEGIDLVYPFVRTVQGITRQANSTLGIAPVAIPPQAMHKYCAADFVLRLNLEGGGTLDLYLQIKEWYTDNIFDMGSNTRLNIVSEFRKHRSALADFHNQLIEGANNHHAVHLLCTVNPVENASWTNSIRSQSSVAEGYLDTISMRKWCPTAALSTSAAMKLRSLVGTMVDNF
jgi:hypothetical protein